MDDFIDRVLKERRDLEAALADLLAKYNRMPPSSRSRELARMIEGLSAEIELRNATARQMKHSVPQQSRPVHLQPTGLKPLS